jgi:hypothetical protein
LWYEQQLADQAANGAIYNRCTLKPQPSQTTGDVFTFRGFPTPSVEGNDVGDLVGMTVSIRTTGNVTWLMKPRAFAITSWQTSSPLRSTIPRKCRGIKL